MSDDKTLGTEALVTDLLDAEQRPPVVTEAGNVVRFEFTEPTRGGAEFLDYFQVARIELRLNQAVRLAVKEIVMDDGEPAKVIAEMVARHGSKFRELVERVTEAAEAAVEEALGA